VTAGDGSCLAIRDLAAVDLDAAAGLFAAGYARQRASMPILPAALLDPAETAPLLRRAIGRGPSAAAFRGDELVGYLIGLPVQGLRGAGTSVHVPEWAHGCAGPDRMATFEALYAALSARWLERGWLVQCISILAGDPELERTLVWLGFGLFVIDAVRGLQPEPAVIAPSAVTVEQAGAGDLDELANLAAGEEAHYAAAPTFLHRDEAPRARMARALDTPGELVWVAREASRILSYMHVRPPHADVCRALQGPRTLAIGGAFTLPGARRRGLARALLAAIAEWARSAGYERLAVDFESANLPARRFWMESFAPVCLSFERHLDDRLRPPHRGEPR
jgi:GNAT superfamily N-acetyltransferase